MATAPVKMAWRTEPGSRAVFEIEISEDEIARAMDAAYAALVKRVQVPGFRRGKAPRVVLERHLGPAALREEALNELLPERFAEAVRDAEVSPVARPTFDVKDAPEGKGLHLTAVVDVYPQITLPDCRALRVERETHPVTDADVDGVLEDFRARHGHLVPAGDEPARRGDYILLKVTRAPGGADRLQAGKELLVEVGGGLLPAEVEAVLEGARAGEDRTAQPAGAESPVEVHVVDVRRKELPALDDAFARTVSDQTTLPALRGVLRERLVAERAEAEERALRERVVDAVLAEARIELPESMVAHEVEHMIEDLTDRLRSKGLSLETYLRSQEKDEAALRMELRVGGERRIRTRLLLREIVKREAIVLTEEEISQGVENLAQESREDAGKTKAWLAQGDRLDALREHLLRQKAMATLVALASGAPVPGSVSTAPSLAAGAEAPGESAE
ncbi:MAG TPA: trigger factor [bacterium]|nr:trigger factor [bacterium]